MHYWEGYKSQNVYFHFGKSVRELHFDVNMTARFAVRIAFLDPGQTVGEIYSFCSESTEPEDNRIQIQAANIRFLASAL